MSTIIPFGVLPGGEEVSLIRLKGNGAVQAEIITLGAIIKSLWVPDRKDDRKDVVLGQDSLEAYLNNQSCSAAVIGRVANRIGGASFSIVKEKYQLEANDRGNCLHSGSGNYATQNFQVEEIREDRVRLSLEDFGKGGFPGMVRVTVEYQIVGAALEITYTAKPSADTPINLTNHCYFNLGGHDSGMPRYHRVMICGDFYTAADQNCLPTGEILRTAGTALDLRELVPLGESLERLEKSNLSFNGFDHNYVVAGRGFRLAAAAEDPESGRRMEGWTDRPGVQFYTANHLDGQTACKEGMLYNRHCAYCFETQNFPDAVHWSHFPNPIVSAGETWRSHTAFRFSIV